VVLADHGRRTRRLVRRRLLPSRTERRVPRGRARGAAARGGELPAGAGRDRTPRRAAGRRRPLRSGPGVAVRRRRDLVRLLDGVAPLDADPVPGSARARARAAAHAARRGSVVLLARRVPPHHAAADRREQLLDDGGSARGDRAREAARALLHRDRRLRRARRRDGAPGLAALATRPPASADARDRALGALRRALLPPLL